MLHLIALNAMKDLTIIVVFAMMDFMLTQNGFVTNAELRIVRLVITKPVSSVKLAFILFQMDKLAYHIFAKVILLLMAFSVPVLLLPTFSTILVLIAGLIAIGAMLMDVLNVKKDSIKQRVLA